MLTANWIQTMFARCCNEKLKASTLKIIFANYAQAGHEETVALVNRISSRNGESPKPRAEWDDELGRKLGELASMENSELQSESRRQAQQQSAVSGDGKVVSVEISRYRDQCEKELRGLLSGVDHCVSRRRGFIHEYMETRRSAFASAIAAFTGDEDEPHETVASDLTQVRVEGLRLHNELDLWAACFKEEIEGQEAKRRCLLLGIESEGALTMQNFEDAEDSDEDTNVAKSVHVSTSPRVSTNSSGACMFRDFCVTQRNHSA